MEVGKIARGAGLKGEESSSVRVVAPLRASRHRMEMSGRQPDGPPGVREETWAGDAGLGLKRTAGIYSREMTGDGHRSECRKGREEAQGPRPKD